MANWAIAALWLPAGAVVGVWTEFALRMQSELTYEKLLQMDPGRWQPAQRCLLTAVVSFVFAFFLSIDAIKIGVGGVLLNDFADNPKLAIAIGGITGLFFSSVRDILFKLRPMKAAS